MANIFPDDKFAENLGIELLHCAVGEARCELTIQEHHKNAHGGVHGGVIFSLADVAFAVACNTAHTAVALQMDIRFMNQPKGERLIAEIKELSSSRKVGHYQIMVTDECDTQVAHLSALAYRIAKR